MTSPSLELQGAIVSALKADTSVTSICAGRVFDRVAAAAQFPYISLGASDEISDDADCIDAFEVTMQIDCWSREPGFPEIRRLADATRRALKTANLSLADNALVTFDHLSTRIFRDPDGLTSHAAMTFQAVVEQP